MHQLPAIRAFFQRHEIAQSLVRLGDCMGGLNKIVVVGGALRELVLAELCSTMPEIPDLDVAVLTDFDTREVIERLGRYRCTATSFGGIRWQTESALPIDVWCARAWAERIGKPSRSQYDILEIKEFLDFNINAGLYAPYLDEVYVDEICESVNIRMLELHNSLVPPDSVQLARIIKLERRVKGLGFELGSEIYRYLVGVIESLDSEGFLESKLYFERKSRPQPTDTAGAYFEARISQLTSKPPTTELGHTRRATRGKN